MKNIYNIVVILFFVWGLIGVFSNMPGCSKEYSCENCRDTIIVDSTWTDTIPQGPIDTVYNDLIAYYDYYIVDNSKVKKQYLNIQDKYIPGHFYIYDSIPIQSTPDGYYTGSFNIKNYYDMSKFVKGDKFSYFYDIRYKNGTNIYSDTITLIY